MPTPGQVSHQKKKFLEHFRVEGNIRQAALAAGIARGNVWRWREHDEHFAQAFRQAELEATEYLEHIAFGRATRSENASDLLLIFLLKARAPEKYRERVEQNVSGAVTVRYTNDWRPTHDEAAATSATGSS
ncbi:MAG TPA: hypothetical protein VGJ60_34045 [Chloroflexota bacterium]|jgi:hypothetical protein